MTELKTLKDIEQWKLRCTKCKTDALRHLVEREKVKAEAIKWVKTIIKVNKELPFDYGGSAIAFAQEFFNITEEDLK